ncbi:MAG: hypothetical protein JSU07_00445 [Bacteroidetes bacterium]|nr:hypothetical protein [Bacteroidota bacterium]
MNLKKIFFQISACTSIFLITSCQKDFQLRFSNLYTEDIDSVLVGNKTAVFTSIARQTKSSYQSIKVGSYNVVCVTKSKVRLPFNINLSGRSGGNRTMQLDGVGSFVVIEE